MSITTEQRLQINERAINRIQDYFEYTYESEKDKEFVYKVLSQLRSDFEELLMK